MMPALPASGVYLRTVMIRCVRYQACFANFMPEEGGSFFTFLLHATAL